MHLKGLETEVGDRGNIVVNIPTSVLPYTPNLSDQDQLNDRFYPEDYADDYDYDEMDGDYSDINPVYSLDSLAPNLRFSRDSSPEDAGNSGENKMAENSAESTLQLTHFRSETADLPYIPKTGVQRSLMVILLKVTNCHFFFIQTTHLRDISKTLSTEPHYLILWSKYC